MTVAVEIKTGKRRLIEYFLSPLIQAGAREHQRTLINRHPISSSPFGTTAWMQEVRQSWEHFPRGLG